MNMDKSTTFKKDKATKVDNSDKVENAGTKSNQKSTNYITNKRLSEKNKKDKVGKKQLNKSVDEVAIIF